MKKLLLFLSLFAGMQLSAAPIKISFLGLGDDDVLNQTIQFLLSKGCDPEAVKCFDLAVRGNNEDTTGASLPLGVDLKEFPALEKGFYNFQSVSNLIKALPKSVMNAGHPYQMNCFDAMILLAGNLMQSNLKPGDIAGPFLAPMSGTNFSESISLVATPRDAFNAMYPQWYIEASKAVFLDKMEDQRICLSAVFNEFRVLPASTTSTNLENVFLKALQTGWKREGVIFPTQVEVVICYNSGSSKSQTTGAGSPSIMAIHAGLLFKNHNQFIYLEKAGIVGPYVRLDLANKADLLPWLKALNYSQSNMFATFNDREIESLDGDSSRSQ